VVWRGCGASNYGTVDVTGTSSALHFVVSLTSGELHDANNFATVAFNLGGTVSTFASSSDNLPLDVTPSTTFGWQFTSLGAGTYHQNGLGDYTFGVDCTSGQTGNVCGSSLIFDVIELVQSDLNARAFSKHFSSPWTSQIQSGDLFLLALLARTLGDNNTPPPPVPAAHRLCYCFGSALFGFKCSDAPSTSPLTYYWAAFGDSVSCVTWAGHDVRSGLPRW